jgi:hypothetical protein
VLWWATDGFGGPCTVILQAAPDYVTEKVFNALKAGAIPVYYGAPNVDNYLPSPAGIINARDFPSGAALAEHIAAVAANESLFASYHRWGAVDVQELMRRVGCDTSPYCQFCEAAARHRAAAALQSRLQAVNASSHGATVETAPAPWGGNKARRSH